MKPFGPSWLVILWPMVLHAVPGVSNAGATGLNVEYGNCAAVLSGPVCILPDDGKLSLWVVTDIGADISLHVDGGRITVTDRTALAQGTRFVVRVSKSATGMTVRSTARNATSDWRLAFDDEALPAQLIDSRQLFSNGQHTAARQLAQDYLRDPDDAYRGIALGLMGRIARIEEKHESSQRYLRDAVRAHLDAGRYSNAVADSTVLAYSLLYVNRDFEAARAALELAGSMNDAPAESRVYLAYFRGLIELDAGNARASLPFLRRAAGLAAALDWGRLALSSDQALATQLQHIGRHDAAMSIMNGWQTRLPDDLTDCEKGNFLTNTGWAALLMLEAGQAADDPTPILEEARKRTGAQCPLVARTNTHVNLALAHLHAGRLEKAVAQLDAAKRLSATPALRTALWWRDIAGRIALANNEPQDALDQFDRLERLAGLTLSGDALWRAAFGKARALIGLGDTDAALAQFERARRFRDDDLLRLPMDEGRPQLIAMRAGAVDAEIEVLVGLGRARDAMRLLRNEQGAELRLLGSRIDEELVRSGFLADYERAREKMLTLIGSLWSLPEDQLERAEQELARQERALRSRLDELLFRGGTGRQRSGFGDPQAGETIVAFHVSSGVWRVIAQRGGEAWIRQPVCDSVDPPDLAQCLVDAVGDVLAASRSIAVLTHKRFADVDFHRLNVRGMPMLTVAPVRYLIETGLESDVDDAAASHAVIVADPRGRLPAARGEARTVGDRLEATGRWSFDLLEGTAATAEAVRQKLDGATLFHFSGHAEFSGAGGWDSELGLARDETLQITDILTLPRVPRYVVLSGCETAREAGVATAASIGLAQAFLARGSRFVVATTRPVDDNLAGALMVSFYEKWQSGGDPYVALQAAQLELKARAPSSDWAAFRLLAQSAGERT